MYLLCIDIVAFFGGNVKISRVVFYIWSPLKTIVPQMRSQIFRQIV